MVTINLLPWRQAARARARRVYLLSCGITIVMSFLAILIWRIALLHEQHLLAQLQQDLIRQSTSLSKRQREIKILHDRRAQTMKVIAMSKQNQQRLRLGTQLLKQLAETMPKGAILRLLEVNGQSIKMQVIITNDGLTSQLLPVLLKMPALKMLQIHQVHKLQNTADYELLLLGKLADGE